MPQKQVVDAYANWAILSRMYNERIWDIRKSSIQ